MRAGRDDTHGTQCVQHIYSKVAFSFRQLNHLNPPITHFGQLHPLFPDVTIQDLKDLGMVSRKKSCCSFEFCPNVSPFQKCIFGQQKESNTIHDPHSKYSAFILEEFWTRGHFERCLNRRFWR